MNKYYEIRQNDFKIAGFYTDFHTALKLFGIIKKDFPTHLQNSIGLFINDNTNLVAFLQSDEGLEYLRSEEDDLYL